MTMQIGKLSWDLSPMMASIESLSAFIAAVEPLANLVEFIDCDLAARSDNRVILRDNIGDLLFGELVACAAIGASKNKCLQIQPADRHVELCAALASNRDYCTVRVRHGWPILVLDYAKLARSVEESSQAARCQ